MIDKTPDSFFTPPGGALTYALVVTNPGPHGVVEVRVEPTRLTFGNWQCAPADSVSCNTADGSGPVDVPVTIPEDDAATIAIDARPVDNDPVPVTNTAPVSAPGGVTELARADSADSDTDAVGMFAASFERVAP